MLLLIVGCSLPASANLIDDMLRSTADSQRQAAIVSARHGRYAQALEQIDRALAKSHNDPDILCNKIVILQMANQPVKALEVFVLLPPKYRVPDYLLPVIGKLYHQVGKNDLSMPYLERALVKNPGSQDIIRTYFAVCLELGALQRARELCNQAARYQTSRHWRKEAEAELLHAEGVNLARMGHWQEAEKLLLQAAAAATDPQSVTYDRIVNFSWGGQHRQAVQLYAALPPKSSPPYYVLDQVARSYFVLGQYAQAESCCLAAMKLEPENLNSANLEFDLLLQQKKYTEAETLLDRFPALAKKRRIELIRQLHREGVMLGRAGNYPAAQRLLDAALRQSKNDPAILSDQIVIYAWANQPRQALERFEKLPSDFKTPPYVLPEIARSYRETHQLEKAIEYYRKVLANAPGRADAALALAALLPAAGRLDEAEKFVTERSRKYPAEAVRLWTMIAQELKKRAVAEARENRLADALRDIRRAVKLSKDPSIEFDYIVILSWNGMDKEAIAAYRSLPSAVHCPVYVLQAVARSYENLNDYDHASEIYRQIIQQEGNTSDARRGLLRMLVKSGKIDAARDYVEKQCRLLGKNDAELLADLGDAYQKAGDTKSAARQYRQALQCDPECLSAQIGMAQILIEKKQWQAAEKLIDRALRRKPDDLPALYAKAELREAQDDFLGAYCCYDKISTLPGGRQAELAKYRLLTTINASGEALKKIDASSVKPPLKQWTEIRGDYASETVRRDDPLPALAVIGRNTQWADVHHDADFQRRCRYDRMIAERQQQLMQQVIDDYQALGKEQTELPYWVLEAAGDAYLYFRQPDAALRLYHQSERQRERMGINRYPDNFELELSIYYALIEKEDYRAAGKILDELEKVVPQQAFQRGTRGDDWDYVAVRTERAWWLIYQDRLPEAEHYLNRLRAAMPMNTTPLVAEAYLHYYRGWPRRALQDFQIADSLNPADVQTKIGLAYALDENGEEKKARELAQQLTKQYPVDNDVKKLNRDLETEDLRTDTVSFSYSQEENQADGFTLSHRLEQPVETNRKVYVENIWKHVMKGGLEDDSIPNTKEVFRNGVGIDWELYRDLTLRGGGSIDYQGKYPAGEGGFDYRINDQWTLAADYTNYSLNAPGWVFLDGGHAQEYSTSLRYRQSEDFNAEFNFDQMFISDNNIRSEWSARQDKALANWAYWKPRLAFEESVTSDSLMDVNYYASRCNIFVYAVPYLEHIWYRNYETAIIDRFYVAPGLQMEDEYQPKFAGYVKYEQEWKLNDRFSLKAAITGTRKNYDGVGSNGFAVDTSVVCHF